jgi:hypothetical protein
MSSILDGLAGQLGPDTVSQISQQLGADPGTTSNAIQLALPLLLGALANNTATPQGAGALDQALARDHDGGLLDDLGALLGGGGGASPALDGAGILGHILGGRQDAARDAIGRSTGLDTGQVMRLLALLAPIVMAYLGRRKREEQLDAGGLSDALQTERADLEAKHEGFGGLLGQFLDQNHDGGIADDIARMAPGLLGSLFGRNR